MITQAWYRFLIWFCMDPVTKQGLQQFCKDYLCWTREGAPVHLVFSRSRGLCSLLESWAVLCWDGYECPPDLPRLKRLMRWCFKAEGLDAVHPFNVSLGAYVDESQASKNHLNIHRLRWVKDHT